MRLNLALVLLLPLLGGTLNLLVGRKLPRRAVEAVACGVIWGSFTASVAALAAYRSPAKVELASWLTVFDFRAPISLYLDPLSLSLILMITFVCGLIHVYSVAYMSGDAGYVRYFALLNLFVFAMLTLVLAENLPLLYLGWEGVGFCSYALIGFWYTEKKNADAGRKAFIVTRIGDIAFGIAIVWLFQLFSTESIVELNGMGFLMPAGVITALGMLFLVGAMGKSAQLPLMVWLPDAMAGPTPVSALIHAATMVTAGVYLLARMLPLIGTPVVLAAIAATGALTAFFAATCALAQRDLKRLLAYSTISQIGYMILGVGAGAVSAATFHLLIHAFFKALLFLGAGCIIATVHHEQDIFKMGGLRKSLPRTFWTFLTGAFCLAGVPLTGGFFSKDAVLGAVWEHGGAFFGGLYALGLVTAFLTSVYTFRAMYLVFGGEDSNHPLTIPPPLRGGGEGRKAVPRLMEYSLFPLALLALCGGLLNLPAYLGGGHLDRFMALKAHGGGVATEMLLQGLAGVVSLTGLAVAHWRYGGKRRLARLAEAGTPSALTRFLLHGWYVDDLYRVLFVRPFERLAGFFWQRVDVGIIDANLDRLAALLGMSGERLGSWTTGRVSVYLLSFAAGLALVLVYMVWVFMG